MLENEAGVDMRKKFRLRLYNGSTDKINLEIKEKQCGFTGKSVCEVSLNECENLIKHLPPKMYDARKPLNLLRINMISACFFPRLIVEYERKAFVHNVGNVRITFDKDIKASKCYTDFTEPEVRGLFPVLPQGLHVLEIKYDQLLPEHIAQLLEIGNLRQTSFSKYYLGRCWKSLHLVSV